MEQTKNETKIENKTESKSESTAAPDNKGKHKNKITQIRFIGVFINSMYYRPVSATGSLYQ